MPTTQAQTLQDDLRLIDTVPGGHAVDFNKNAFLFSHALAGHPLFTLPRLARLAERLLGETQGRNIRWQSSGAPVDAGWDVPLNDKIESVNEAIANLASSGSWVLLYSVQRDPEYRALLDQLMEEILENTGLSRDAVTWEDAYVFLASPGSTTPYHIDHEATFLFQIHGNRTANIWSAHDRSILSDQEIEAYYAGDFNAARYREENQRRAAVFALDAGKGVHHPSRAPHWFRNGNDYSVALGVHFCVRECDAEAAPYQMNHLLRKIGLRPTAPGQSAWKDKTKSAVIRAFAKRDPQSKNDMLRSGYNRMTWPLRRFLRMA